MSVPLPFDRAARQMRVAVGTALALSPSPQTKIVLRPDTESCTEKRVRKPDGFRTLLVLFFVRFGAISPPKSARVRA